MSLTAKQEEGLKITLARYKEDEKYTVIAGYAGSGKSYLCRFIIEELKNLGIKDEDVCFACFTGKAAQVLQKRGNKNVSTLHKLLYESHPLRDGSFYHSPRLSIPYKVVVVDEVSMAPLSIMNLLFSHDVYVICLGDPGQLPPIWKDEDNHLLDHPHVFLDEIMRQAQESEIIRLSMLIREGKPIRYQSGKEVQVIRKQDLNTGMLMWADQILVGTNNSRTQINNQMRELLGRGKKPEDGDKVICLRNYWKTFSSLGEPLVNGTIGYLNNSYTTQHWLHPRFASFPINVLGTDFVSDSGMQFPHLELDTKMILTGEKCLDAKTAYQVSRSKDKHLVPLEFTYGYAITVHKAQGNEWDKVLVLEERFPFAKEEHKRWLYTAVTRAAEKLVLIR